MFAAIYGFFGTILSWFNSITGSYAVALILYALLFKVLFLPFSIKTQKNQIAQAKLRPQIAKIEKKYAGRNDRVTLQKKQQEIMELQQREGAGVLSGCLPMLLQIPIILLLYNVIRNPLSYIAKWSGDLIKNISDWAGLSDQIQLVDKITSEYAQNGLTNLAAKGVTQEMIDALPNFHVFGVNLAATPSLTNFSILVLIPVLAAGFQWLSMFLMKQAQKGSQPSADTQTRTSMILMDLTFPLLTLWMAFSFSGMLGLYWIYQSILGIAQQLILNKVMPLPKFTAEELKEIEKAQKAQAQAQRAALAEKPRYKSLHHIDDDDYDELPEIKSQSPKDKKGDAPLSGGELKDDRNRR